MAWSPIFKDELQVCLLFTPFACRDVSQQQKWVLNGSDLVLEMLPIYLFKSTFRHFVLKRRRLSTSALTCGLCFNNNNWNRHLALSAWRRGHRICLRNCWPGSIPARV
jgi:hypothetical protein